MHVRPHNLCNAQNKSLLRWIHIQLAVVAYTDVYLSVWMICNNRSYFLSYVPREQPLLLLSLYLQHLRLSINLWK